MKIDEKHMQTCPECGEIKRTPEALRVHRWLAHAVHELPPADIGTRRPVKTRRRIAS